MYIYIYIYTYIYIYCFTNDNHRVAVVIIICIINRKITNHGNHILIMISIIICKAERRCCSQSLYTALHLPISKHAHHLRLPAAGHPAAGPSRSRGGTLDDVVYDMI